MLLINSIPGEPGLLNISMLNDPDDSAKLSDQHWHDVVSLYTLSSKLELNVTHFSNSSCSDHWGKVCAGCREGYRPSVNSCAVECLKCDSSLQTRSVITYVFHELIPLTVVFIMLLVFNVCLTSGPVNAFVFFSQTITATSVRTVLH